MNRITIPRINKDLAYFCGILAGDGYIGIRPLKNEYNINIGGNPKDEVDYYDLVVAPLFFSLFNLKVIPKKMNSTYGINTYSKELVLFLVNKIGMTISPKDNLVIPPIFLEDENLVLEYICGVADTDFSFQIKRNSYPTISGSSKCKNFMEQISKILHKHEFKVNKYFDYKIIDTRFKKGYNLINRVELNGHKQFAMWDGLIGTRHPKNQKKFELWKKIIAERGFEPPTFTRKPQM